MRRLWLLLFLGLSCISAQKPCILKEYPGVDTNYVCVCNATYCDTLPRLRKLAENEVAVYSSSMSGKRFDLKFTKFAEKSSNDEVSIVKLNAQETFQSIIGFGGAFTDSSGVNLRNLSGAAQALLMRSYFGKEGLEYNIGRVPMASCDFSTHEYSYLDTADDFELKTFNLTKEDFYLKLPYIQEALKLTGGKLRLFASPWSAPGWMKTNGRMVGGAPMKGDVNGRYYQTWGQYFIRFLEEYHKNGVDFWGLTAQNEPSSGLDPLYGWQTMFFSAEMQRDFIKGILGPLLKNSTLGKDIKLMCLDDQRFLLPTWADTIFADPETSKYVDGIGVHWYEDYITPAHNLKWTFDKHPDKFILGTEACNGYLPFTHGAYLGDWSRGDSYAHDIIEDLNNYVAGWTDWNLCLDMDGGPNFVKNFVDAPIIVNGKEGEFYKQPMFYVMGHFSKFVKPTSIRIGLSIDSKAQHLEGVAFTTPDNQRVLVINNRGVEATYRLQIEDAKNPGSFAYVDVEPRSIHTVIWNKTKTT